MYYSHKVIGGYLVLLVLLCFLTGVVPVRADENPSVQLLTGRLGKSEIRIYAMPGLTEGESLQFYAQGISGNLDPFLGITDHAVSSETIRTDFNNKAMRVIDDGGDPVEALPEIAGELFLAWDDDGGDGRDAALEFDVPADGDYWLVLSRAPFYYSFGDFELTIGIDAPAVLTGDAEPTGASIANLDVELSELAMSVQETTGSLTAEKPTAKHILNSLEGGDTIYVFVEALSEDLHPVLELQDAGGKLLRAANLSGQSNLATLQYTFDTSESGIDTELFVHPFDDAAVGEYRLLLGVNAPEVLSGDAEPVGREILKLPITVQAAIQLEQITGVDQKGENFGAVANLLLSWQDDALAFDPVACDCSQRTFTYDEFIDFVTAEGIRWPVFQVQNQQGNRWTQGQYIVVQPDGSTLYFERFWTTLQAPDFNFKDYPFDEQHFFIRLDLLNSEEYFVFADLEGETKVGDQLGEEQWAINNYYTSIDTQQFGSRFTFHFIAGRHLDYYMLRVFVPLGLIIIISWTTFFLRDYTKRIEVASANFLVFVALNFAISDSLPKLGYTTFLDAIIIVVFIITVAVIVVNIAFKKMEIGGRGERARRIDDVLIWGYPLLYVFAVTLIALLYLL